MVFPQKFLPTKYTRYTVDTTARLIAKQGAARQWQIQRGGPPPPPPILKLI